MQCVLVQSKMQPSGLVHRTCRTRRRLVPYKLPDYKDSLELDEPNLKAIEDVVVIRRLNQIFGEFAPVQAPQPEPEHEHEDQVLNGDWEINILIAVLIIYSIYSCYCHTLNILKTVGKEDILYLLPFHTTDVARILPKAGSWVLAKENNADD